MLILHTTGARSGKERLAPLIYRQEGERIFLFASKGGADTHPDWYYNLTSNPAVTIEIGSETVSGTAVELAGQERDDVYARQGVDLPFFAEYQAGTERTIPVIEIVRS